MKDAKSAVPPLFLLALPTDTRIRYLIMSPIIFVALHR